MANKIYSILFPGADQRKNQVIISILAFLSACIFNYYSIPMNLFAKSILSYCLCYSVKKPYLENGLYKIFILPLLISRVFLSLLSSMFFEKIKFNISWFNNYITSLGMSGLITSYTLANIAYFFMASSSAPLKVFIMPFVNITLLYGFIKVKQAFDSSFKKNINAKINILKSKFNNLRKRYTNQNSIEAGQIRKIKISSIKYSILPFDCIVRSVISDDNNIRIKILDDGIETGQKLEKYCSQGLKIFAGSKIKLESTRASSDSSIGYDVVATSFEIEVEIEHKPEDSYLYRGLSEKQDIKENTKTTAHIITSSLSFGLILLASISGLTWSMISDPIRGISIAAKMLGTVCPCALLFILDTPNAVLKQLLFNLGIIINKLKIINLVQYSRSKIAYCFDINGTLTYYSLAEQGIKRIQREEVYNSRKELIENILCKIQLEFLNRYPRNKRAEAIIEYFGGINQARIKAQRLNISEQQITISDNADGAILQDISVDGANQNIYIGSKNYLSQSGVNISDIPEQYNNCTVFVAIGNTAYCGLDFSYNIRAGARDFINNLISSGNLVYFLTGDTEENARRILTSAEINLTGRKLQECLVADCRPTVSLEEQHRNKSKFISELKRKLKIPVVFVGDGPNDRDAALAADFSIAMGASNAAADFSDLVVNSFNNIQSFFRYTKLINNIKFAFFSLFILFNMFTNFGIATNSFSPWIIEKICCFSPMSILPLMAMLACYSFMPLFNRVIKNNVTEADSQLEFVEIVDIEPPAAEVVIREDVGRESGPKSLFAPILTAAAAIPRHIPQHISQLSQQASTSTETSSRRGCCCGKG